MTRIGILSDTHGYIDDRIFEYFENCDEIWHCGDWGSIEAYKKLSAFKPIKAVWGNIDGYDFRSFLPEHNRFMCEDVSVWITHIGGYPGNYDRKVKTMITHQPPKLFVCGHSHILKVLFDKELQCLHINPGAAGKSGFHKVKTLVRFEIDKDKIQNLEVIEMKD